VASGSLVLCDNRPGMGRDGARLLNPENWTACRQGFRTWCPTGSWGVDWGVVSQGWPRRRLPCSVEQGEQPCRTARRLLRSSFIRR